MPKQNALQDKIRELQLRRLAASSRALASGGNTKKKAKPVGYKMQNTFEKNLKGVPGGSMSRGVASSLLKQMEARHTGTKTVSDEYARQKLGPMKSMRNANTTSGNYVRAIVVDESGRNMADAQGRKVFGR